MTPTEQDLAALADIATEAARSAGALIASSRPASIEHKGGGLSLAAQVVTEIDRAAEARILDILAPTLDAHDLGLLSEERPDDGSRQGRSRFWCIDPLDGTLPYIEGKPGYAVSIGLVSKSGEPLIGVVYLPAEDVLFRAIRGSGAQRNGAAFRAHDAAGATSLAVLVDRSFDAHPHHGDIMSGLDEIVRAMSLSSFDIREGAGGVVNACRVLESAAGCYFKLPKPNRGGGSLWDFAATACLAREAGAIATDIFGAQLDLNRADSTFMNHRGVLFASNERLAQAVRQRFRPWLSSWG